MSVVLTKEQSSMVQESARGLNGAAASDFETAVVARLDAMAATGVTITTPNVKTAITQELTKGK
jgi:hypothetical protein